MGKEIIAEIYFEIIMKSWKSWLIIFSSKGLLLKIFVYIYGFKYLFGTIWYGIKKRIKKQMSLNKNDCCHMICISIDKNSYDRYAYEIIYFWLKCKSYVLN